MENRREFLKTSAAFMAALGAFGLTELHAADLKGAASPEVRGDTRLLQSILMDAMLAGDMAPALTKYKGRISKSQEGALSQITKNDLLLLKNLKNKFEFAGATQHEGAIIF